MTDGSTTVNAAASQLAATPTTEPTGVMAVLGFLPEMLVLVGVPILLLELFKLIRGRQLNWHRGSGMLTSLFCMIPSAITRTVAVGAAFAAFAAIAAWTPWSISTTWMTAILCLLAVDFAYYWEHRIAHEVNLIWAAYHATHHSADHYDQTVAQRISFVSYFVKFTVYLPVAFMGFAPELIVICFFIVLTWQQWLHTETIGKLPVMDFWFNTPSNHRVHHGRNEQYIDKNYGGMLIIWDRLFGTYAAEVEPVDYGLVEQNYSRNPLAVHFAPFGKLMKEWGTTETLRERLILLFGKPGALAGHRAQTASPSVGSNQTLAA